MTSEMMPEDAKIMGTPEEAAEKLAALAMQWRQLRQPLMADAKEHRRIDSAERECRFQLANAALLWLWHRENTRPAPAGELAALAEAWADATDRYGYTGDQESAEQIAKARAAFHTALAAHLAEVRAAIGQAHSAMLAARDSLYNAFEPDNQSRAWHRADESVSRLAALAKKLEG